jgi:RHS repeat-associated protein
MGLNASGADIVTTTYGYDAFGQRVVQTGTSTTTIYPFKWYSIASSTANGAKYSTTTEYVFNGDILLATVDQQIAGGAATGTAQIRYVHPDHLGSTNVVTNASGTVVQTLDYFPYGGLRIESGTDVSTRKYIGERYDQNTDLNYFNARYYQSSRGQFLSQDPTFLALGNPAAVNALSKVDQSILLSDPQALNSYSYALNNPIRFKDKDGKFIDVPWISNSPWVQDAATAAYQQSPTWRFAMDHPNTTAAIVAVGSYPALASGGSAIAAFQMAGAAGVGTTFMAQQAFAGVVYSALTIDSTMAIPGLVGQFGQINPRNPSSFGPAAWSLLTGPVAARVGGYPGAFADAYQFGGLLNRTLGTAAGTAWSMKRYLNIELLKDQQMRGAITA